jgi:hypothetical protein
MNCPYNLEIPQVKFNTKLTISTYCLNIQSLRYFYDLHDLLPYKSPVKTTGPHAGEWFPPLSRNSEIVKNRKHKQNGGEIL